MVKQWDGILQQELQFLKLLEVSISKLDLKELKINKKTFTNDPFICYKNNFNSDKLKLILKQF